MGAEWINHKGKKILYINYEELDAKGQLELIKNATEILIKSGSKENLTLSDVRKITITQEFTDMAKEQGKISGTVTKKAAVIGVAGIRKVILTAVNNFSGNPRKPFDTLEEAKDWLAE